MCAGIQNHDDPRYGCDCHLIALYCDYCGEVLSTTEDEWRGCCEPCNEAHPDKD
jgi:hypothetical protein